MLERKRIAINQATTRTQWGFRDAVEGYSRHGVKGIGAWREGIEELGVRVSKKLLDDNGLAVTSLNRAGPLIGLDRKAHLAAMDDARRAIDIAAELEAGCLPVMPGALPPQSRDIGGIRAQYSAALAELLPVARASGVVLALEPLHPMVAADRSCMNTMTQANDLCDALGGGLGILVDVYHIWWDSRLQAEIERAGKDRIVGFHVSDWLVPTRDFVFDRGMMGDGVIDIPLLRSWVEQVGYSGFVEVELFSKDWWAKDPEQVVQLSIERCLTVV
ncbi:hypothetical protein AU467_34585 [Mesorhizobium loti]|uniref:Xylose isomerase-like TIM barrel domain-containing protein n=1 Tax=Rhizobium loti TaxID=381 RepID=A0A117N4Z2_RHILI|nr:hypothetical protein AU467_34585 [Mesorhizobium loti]